MKFFSTRQHLVPGFLDASEDELAEKKRDPWIIIAVLVSGTAIAIGAALLFFASRG